MDQSPQAPQGQESEKDDEKQGTRILIDPELRAMRDAYKAISALDADAQHRVVDWITAKVSDKNPRRAAPV